MKNQPRRGEELLERRGRSRSPLVCRQEEEEEPDE
jgi:hypothetical protein